MKHIWESLTSLLSLDMPSFLTHENPHIQQLNNKDRQISSMLHRSELGVRTNHTNNTSLTPWQPLDYLIVVPGMAFGTYCMPFTIGLDSFMTRVVLTPFLYVHRAYMLILQRRHELNSASNQQQHLHSKLGIH